jgi:hypothetical protein
LIPDPLVALPNALGGGSGGCAYHRYCERAQQRCTLEEPPLEEIAPFHRSRCWFPGDYDGPPPEAREP